jgi:hypothetical protein
VRTVAFYKPTSQYRSSVDEFNGDSPFARDYQQTIGKDHLSAKPVFRERLSQSLTASYV